MGENKKNNVLIIAVIMLSVVVLGLIGYIVYDKVKSGDKPQNNIDNNIPNDKDQINSAIPDSLSEYSMLYWNYDKIYNYYFTMNDNQNAINIDSNFKDVKIENNKLYWNIDNQWSGDKNIVDDVKYIHMGSNNYNGVQFVVVTNTNKIYYITFDGCFNCDSVCTKDSPIISCYKDLTTEAYNNFKYKEIVANGEITKVSAKDFSACEVWKEYYFEIGNKIYILNTNENKLDDLNSLLNEKTITSLENTCNPLVDMALKIEQDGTIKEIVDNNNNLINVKHYVLLAKDNDNYINLIIDKNDHIYVIDNNKKTQSVFDKVINFEYTKDEFGNEKLNIDLENNNDIVKGK